MQKPLSYFILILLDIAGVVLIALEQHFWGWVLLCCGAAILFFTPKNFRTDILLLYLSIALLGITAINTDISIPHMFTMGLMLILVLCIPYVTSKYIYKNHHIRYQLHHGRKWNNPEVFYILLTAIVAYFLFPYMLKSTNAYLNWSVQPGITNLTLLFIGTNALGIWDELFFINTVLAILRRYFPFAAANVMQSILFTSFLYELGFRGWCFIIIFFFALLQGYIFKKTESLLYVITVHLTADLMLFLALIYLYHPTWMPIFIY
jgi:membrane protease YdiL (CAAX protease family)